jgi:hypothetical protein
MIPNGRCRDIERVTIGKGKSPVKWFKHISDSIDDPFISELCEEFGPSGYYVFFGTLELYAREFKTKNDWFLCVSVSFLCRKLFACRKNKIKTVLDFIDRSNKWEVSFKGSKVNIHIPKFRKYMDETTLKKLRCAEDRSGIDQEVFRNNSGTVPEAFQKSSTTDVEAEAEAEGLYPPDGAGGHFSQKITAADLVERIEQSGNLILALSGKNGFKPFQWVQMQLKKYGNPLAITEALEATAKQYPKGFKKEPIAYCQGVFKKLNPTYNEKESKAVSDGYKRIEPDEVLNSLISTIGEKV